MVLKKTNCEAVNSGNTMKKRYFRQIHQKNAARTTHVIKILINIPVNNPLDRSWEVDLAENYIDDGGLKPCKFSHWFPSLDLREIYSLNKKKRWLLNLRLRSAVYDYELHKESFKVTFVHRLVPCHGVLTNRNTHRNVTCYCDSQGKSLEVEPKGIYSTRLDLARIAAGHVSADRRRHRKTRPGHNQHFRDLQRKPVRPKKTDSRTMPDNTLTDVPEIRYELAEPEPLNSLSLRHWDWKGGNSRWPNENPGTRFRGSRRQRVEWYFEDSLLRQVSFAYNRKRPDYAADSLVDEEDEEDTERLWSPPPQTQDYSLWELAQATQHRRCRTLKRTLPSTTTTTTTTTGQKRAICPASSRTVRKHGKGTAVFIGQEHSQDASGNTELGLTDLVDADDDSGLHSNEDSDPDSLENMAQPVIDHEKEFARFDTSFSSCGIPDKELKVWYLQDRFAGAVEFARCAPLTVKFDLQAVWEALHGGMKEESVKGGDELEEWWVLFQVGEVGDSGLMAGEPGEDVDLVKVRVFGSFEEQEVATVNDELTCVLTGEDRRPMVLSVSTLLNKVCSVVRRMAANRRSNTLAGSRQVAPKRRYRPLEGFLPHRRYTDKVEVCSMKEAYHRLQSAKKQSPSQTTKLEELDLSCTVDWCHLQCSICFTQLEDMGASGQGFTFYVAMITCGHSFCRQCWQRHLMSSVVGGNTSLRCMTCETTVDPTTVMSLVPRWVYDRWQQRLQSQMVEGSGEWRWCPNAHCGRLARTPRSQPNGKQDDTKGVPVACLCHKRWCLDCGQDAHWPITCAQFSSYTKMLRQKGEEDGMKTTHLEITSVQVKRCPFCRYPIEKSGGCSHMSCSQCRNQFCWVCLADWSVHVTGAWHGCQEKAVETIDLENERLYPLPIECYQKAVTHRSAWKRVDREQHSKLIIFRSNYAVLRLKETLHEDALDHIVDAFMFLKKAHMLLELSFILLSNSPRRHRLGRLLSSNLQPLHFLCDRVAQHVNQPVKHVLQTSDHLRKITSYGHLQMDHVSLLAHRLVSRVPGPSKQAWLLQDDHEHFVKFK